MFKYIILTIISKDFQQKHIMDFLKGMKKKLNRIKAMDQNNKLPPGNRFLKVSNYLYTDIDIIRTLLPSLSSPLHTYIFVSTVFSHQYHLFEKPVSTW